MLEGGCPIILLAACSGLTTPNQFVGRVLYFASNKKRLTLSSHLTHSLFHSFIHTFILRLAAVPSAIVTDYFCIQRLITGICLIPDYKEHNNIRQANQQVHCGQSKYNNSSCCSCCGQSCVIISCFCRSRISGSVSQCVQLASRIEKSSGSNRSSSSSSSWILSPELQLKLRALVAADLWLELTDF